MQINYNENPDTFKISEDKIANLILIDISGAGKVIPFVFDTGATLTVISESTAKAFHAIVSDESITGGGNAGSSISGSMATIAEVRIGNTLLQNLEVAVVTDEMLDFGIDDKENQMQVNGFLGWDIIQSFKWYFDNTKQSFTIELPVTMDINVVPNMKDWDNMPIIQVDVDGREEIFGFDTGNTESTIGCKLYPMFEGVTESKDSIVGIDGVKEEMIRLIEHFKIKVGKQNVILNNISAINRQVFPTSNKDVCGLLGVDVIQGKSWVLDYKNRIFEIVMEV